MNAIRTEDRAQVRLRVGILLGGHLVEDKVLPPGRDITVGTGERCTCMVPSAALPRRWPLFRWRDGGWQLWRHAAMAGRLAEGEHVAALPRAQAVPLRQRVRGRISVADVTVLFQVVRWPKLARPLPTAVRGSVLAMVDRPFAITLALCFVAQLVFVLQLRRIDWPRSVEHLADDFKQVFLHRPLPKQDPVATAGPAQTTARTKAKHRQPTITRPAPRPFGERKAELTDAINKVGLLAVLTAKSTEGSGAWTDLLGHGAVERSQETALAGINAVQLASAGSSLGIRVAGGSGTVVDIRGLSSGRASIAAADTGARRERRVPHVNSERPSLDSSSAGHLDPGQLAREVRGRMGALRACYERSLKRNPNLAGKLILQLSITAAGTVSGAELSSDSLDDPDLTSCVRASVLRWRFPPPEGGSIEATFPFVFQSAS